MGKEEVTTVGLLAMKGKETVVKEKVKGEFFSPSFLLSFLSFSFLPFHNGNDLKHM